MKNIINITICSLMLISTTSFAANNTPKNTTQQKSTTPTAKEQIVQKLKLNCELSQLDQSKIKNAKDNCNKIAETITNRIFDMAQNYCPKQSTNPKYNQNSCLEETTKAISASIDDAYMMNSPQKIMSQINYIQTK